MKLVGGLFAMGVYAFFAALLFISGVIWWHANRGNPLPSTADLMQYAPPTLSRVHNGDGLLMAEFAEERRIFTPIDEVPDLVKHAFISAEDRFFFDHGGVDGVGVAKAMVDNMFRVMSGRKARGASTITMQVVKNFLLSGERAISRKIREAILAMRLEAALTKEQILELYLNEIYLGKRSYGVTAAASNYFGKRIEDLAPHEVAFLAALPKAPSDYDPVSQRDRATSRRDYVLREMRENGYLTEEEYAAAVAEPLQTLFDLPLEERLQRNRILAWDYFAEQIRRDLIDDLGRDEVYGGGLSIRGTMDPTLQDAARRALQTRLFSYSTARGYTGPIAQIEDLNTEDEAVWREQLADARVPRDISPWRPAVVLLVGQRSAQIGIEGVESEEPIYLPFSDVREWAAPREGYNGEGYPVLGAKPEAPEDVFSVGDVIYVEEVFAEDGTFEKWSLRQIPEVNGAVVAMDPHTGRVLAMQGGFSFEASVFNRATQARRQPGSAFKPFVYAAALERGYRPNMRVLDIPLVIRQEDGTVHKFENYSKEAVNYALVRWGIERSLNLTTVRIAQDITLEAVAEYAETFGVYEDMPPLISYALGAGETTLLQLTTSYAMFVNGGKRIRPTLIDRIQDRHGQTIYRHDRRTCLECATPEWRQQGEPWVPDEWEQVMDPVTAYQLVAMMNGVTIRGTAAFLGTNLPFPTAGKTGTSNDVKDAWFVGFTPDLVVGCFIGYDTPRPMGRGGTGGSMCGPVFQDVMAVAMEGKPAQEFRRPPGVVLNKIDRISGACVDADRAGAQYIWEAFRATDDPCSLSRMIGGPAAAALGDLPFSSQTLEPEDAAVEGGAAVEPVGGAGAGAPARPQRPSAGSLTRGGIY